MKYVNRDDAHKSGYAHNTLLVELEGNEHLLTEGELITLADNHFVPGQPRRHFGGSVEKRQGRRTKKWYARIKVYTD